jgi:hypothetical protein
MKFGKTTLFLLAALGLLLVAAAPRFETVDISVDNRTGQSVSLFMNGPGQSETVFLASDQSESLEVLPGEYFYRYEACGHMNFGTFSATAAEPTLILRKCAGVSTSNIVVDNQTGSPFILTLNGLGGLYGYWVPVGGLTIQVPAGGYQYNATTCGPNSGTVKASASLQQPIIWSWDCDGEDPTVQASAE